MGALTQIQHTAGVCVDQLWYALEQLNNLMLNHAYEHPRKHPYPLYAISTESAYLSSKMRSAIHHCSCLQQSHENEECILGGYVNELHVDVINMQTAIWISDIQH